MSNTVDFDEIKSVDQIKKELTTLKRENVAAMATINKLLKDLSKKNEEIEHLKQLLSQTVPVIQPQVPEKKKTIFDITPEEEIALAQLDRLRKVALARPLTLEETKIYDLLVKNKRLSKDESTINLSKSSYREVSEADLLEIAGKVHESDKDNT